MNKKALCLANELIEAHYRLSLQEAHVILWLIKKIQPDDEDFKTHELSVTEFANLTGLDINGQYEELQKVTLRLIQRTLRIRPRGEKKLIQVSWLSSAVYKEGYGYASLCFDPNLKPYLLQLKEIFTKIPAKEVFKLKSIYAIRIYELLVQYAPLIERGGKDNREITVQELREYCGIQDNEYKLYGHFKSRVIEPARDEINAKTDYAVDFQEYKFARKVKSLTWTIKKKETVLSKEDTPFLSLFNEITDAFVKFSSLQEEEIKATIKAHSLPGDELENWKIGLKNAMNDGFYAGKKPMRKGEEKGMRFKFNIKYAAENLPKLLSLREKEEFVTTQQKSSKRTAREIAINYEACTIPEITEFCRKNEDNLGRPIVDYLLNIKTYLKDNSTLSLSFSNAFYSQKCDVDEIKEKLKTFFMVDSVIIH